MKRKLTNNLGLKLASLALAFVLWFLVVQIDDPKETDRFSNVQVKLINTELLEEEGKVYEVLDDTDKVNVTVSAPRSILKQLRASDIVAEADMSRLTDINTIAITYNIENAEVSSIVGDHDVVRLSVEDKKSRWIRLTSNVVSDVDEGYMVYSTSLDQTNIQISGPESAVSLVDHAVVDISVTGTNSISANVDIQLVDGEGNVMDNSSIKKNVDSAHITVEVLATKEVPVEIQYTGKPAEGYVTTGIVESSMPTVTVAGSSSTLASVSSLVIPMDRIDITGATDNVQEIVNLKDYLPDNVRFADKKFDGRVTATVYVEPIVEKELQVPVSNVTIVNMPEGFVAELPEELESYTLTVSGLNEFIEPLQQNMITGTIDVAAWMEDRGLEALRVGATYTMPVTFTLAEEISILSEVTVDVKIAEEEEVVQ